MNFSRRMERVEDIVVEKRVELGGERGVLEVSGGEVVGTGMGVEGAGVVGSGTGVEGEGEVGSGVGVGDAGMGVGERRSLKALGVAERGGRRAATSGGCGGEGRSWEGEGGEEAVDGGCF